MTTTHSEVHHTHRVGWLRAAVLGANDGVVSTASLIIGVSSSGASRNSVIVAGLAGLVAGAMSMAAGEYVSVSSQADTERADLAREATELATEPERELTELVASYQDRGLDETLARQVAEALTAHDAIGTHAREELGISEATTARPVQAAFVSAATFAIGAALPLAAAVMIAGTGQIIAVALTALVFLAVLGAIGARAGGAPMLIATVRVTFWGALAMAITALIGNVFGAAI